MVSLLRQLVASPRTRHPEAGLDLCYVTDFIIATSGPSQTYPELAYRNPLDQLVAFLDAKHGPDWAIWEFRAEGTGYPDSAVYNRIWHYPWPDHHPPPFRLIPIIMASMRNWLHADDKKTPEELASLSTSTCTSSGHAPSRDEKRVVVVHCKAGKGRSGTASCSYLIAEEGWKAEDALRQFTERRMRPQFGPGVSIPSQLRWVGYVDRWTKGGKRYLDGRVEVLEIRAYGLRNGVRIDVEGFVDEGKRIERVHGFTREERVVEVGGAPEGGSLSDIMWDLAGYPATADDSDAATSTKQGKREDQEKNKDDEKVQDQVDESVGAMLLRKGVGKMDKLRAMMTPTPSEEDQQQQQQPSSRASESEEPEPGGMEVVFRPAKPIILHNSDINIAVERRGRTSRSMGLSMLTAVAHVWFNVFFEGGGPENAKEKGGRGRADREGVFSIDWEGMDGIKGSSRKGARALDRLAVAWRAVDVADQEEGEGGEEEEIREPREGEFVPQVEAADWHLEGKAGEDENHEMEGVKTSGPRGGSL